MVKFFPRKDRISSKDSSKSKKEGRDSDPNRYLFFVYVKWSKENRVLKTFMRSRNLDSEKSMVCQGLSDVVSNPHMRLNNKNITMAVLYQLDDDHDTSRNFDVSGIVPTRLHHYLNSNPRERIHFEQEEIDEIVNGAEFTYRA